MSKTIARLYENLTTAQQTVEELIHAGIDRQHISILAHNANGQYDQLLHSVSYGDAAVSRDAIAGAVGGAVAGGVGGLLISIVALAIPGLGPFIAAGPLFAAIAGAGLGTLGGGLVGALIGLGVAEHEAEYYAEAVRQGCLLVTVTDVSSAMIEETYAIMDERSVNLEEQVALWKERGWETGKWKEA